MVPLATGLSDFEAKVLTARLGADGIIWQVRGVLDSVYPIGATDVLVPDAELDAARLVAEVDALLAGDLAARSDAARSLGRPDAAAAVADLVETHARPR